MVYRFILGPAFVGAVFIAAAMPVGAQTGDGVSVDLGAIDQGSSAPTNLAPPVASGRIVLTPPTGTNPVSRPSAAPIKLKPPPSARQVSAAKAPAAAKEPAPTAAAKPAPAPIAARQVAEPPPPAPAPVAPVKQEPPAPTIAAPAAAMAPPPTAMPKPSAAAAQSAATEPAGPVNTPLARESTPSQAEQPAQTASLPPPDQALPSDETIDTISMVFDAGSAQVSGDAQGKVSDLAQRMSGDRSLRVQLLAYASDPDKNTSKARRMALDRAVSVRNMLIDAGVERTRIEVRALGDQGDAGPADRVDAIAVKR